MVESNPAPFETEVTDQGEQGLIPEIKPITQRDRLDLLVNAPLVPRREQKPLNIGLFDEDSRAQLDFLDFIRAAERGISSPTQIKE